MRIIVNGQQAFGRAVLEALLERGENVVGVYTAPDGDGPVDSLKASAVERGIPVWQPKSFRRPPVREQMRSLAPDLGVMAYVTAFVPEEALNIPTFGTIQYHPSLLPMHKGPSAINWSIAGGETRTGLSIFWPDNGFDTGPILLQKEIAIGPDATVGSIYFDHLFPMGVEAMLEAVDLVRTGNAPRIPQDAAIGSYEGWFRTEDAAIDWSKPAQRIYNLIRGADPQPGAWTRHGGRKLQIFACRLALDSVAHGPQSTMRPGEVQRVDERGFVVSAPGGTIEVLRVRAEGEVKTPAGEFAAAVGLKTGDRFGAA